LAKYRVVLEDESRRNIDVIYEWIAQRSPEGASRWYRAALNALGKLHEDADRFPLAPESQHFDRQFSERF
jgi:hypothetical protein